jgi:hypothetical protein
MAEPSRHLSTEILLAHLASGVAMVYPFPGEPAAELLIDGSVPRVTLWVDAKASVAGELNTLKNVRVADVHHDRVHRVSVVVSGEELMIDGHAMLCAVADRVQLEGMAANEAVRETLEQWRAVLAARTRMSIEAEVGLVGELLLLDALAVELGDDALTAWRGALSEEHDFGLVDADVEVKTTMGERRRHWIGSLTQLRRSPQRPLVLVSLQITRGGQVGVTLAELVDRLRSAFTQVDQLNAKLVQAGWDDEAGDLFVDRWALRTPPATFDVAGQFPAITPADIAAMPIDASGIAEVHYRIDLDGRPVDATDAEPLRAALAHLSSYRGEPA